MVVYNREKSNNMYRASTYFVATWISNTIVFLFYPLITSSVALYSLNLENESYENIYAWFHVNLLLSLIGGSLGFMCACMCNDILISF